MIRRDFTRFQGKNYAGPRLRNPFFSQSTGKMAWIAMMLVGTGGVIAAVLVLIYAPFMQFQRITITGLTTLNEADLRAASEQFLHGRVALVIPGTHVLFGREEALAAHLKEQFTLAEVHIAGQGRELSIGVRERISELAWRAGGKTYLLDLAGTVVREASAEAVAAIDARLAQAAEIPFAPGTQPTMPIMIDNSAGIVTPGASLMSAELLQDVLTIDESLRDREWLPLAYRFTSPTTPWLTVEVANGPALLIDLQQPQHVPTAMSYLDVYMQEYPDARSTLEYIDLRFDNHLYTKPRTI